MPLRMRPLFGFVVICLLSCFAATPVFAQESRGPTVPPPSHIWIGSEASSYWTDAANWLGGNLPQNEGEDVVLFFNESYYDWRYYGITIDDSLFVDSLIFSGSLFVDFHSAGGTIESLDIASGVYGLGYETSAEVYFSPDVPVSTSGDTTWYLNYGFEVEIAGVFTNTDKITLTGGGTLLFAGDNASTLSGEITVLNGTLGLAHDKALGTATVILGDSEDTGYFSGLLAVDGDRSIGNNIEVRGGVLSSGEYYSGENNELNLYGRVTFTGDTTLYNNEGLLSFEGLVTETTPGTNLDVYAYSPVIFDGETDISGRITAQSGAIIFGNDTALPGQAIARVPAPGESQIEEPQLPTPSFASTSYGYIGLIEETLSDRFDALSAFIALFNPAETVGTIGLDTAPSATAINSYAAPIDLTGFNESVLLGSLTRAEYTGLLTPAGTNYRLGNGGGTLLLGSTLTDNGESNRGLEVISNYDTPLTVYLNSSSNSFSGNVIAQYSAVIFGHAPGTLPGGVQFELREGGYIGYQDTTVGVANFLSRFDATTTDGIIGFDSPDRQTNLAVTDAIDLSRFTATNPEFYLGTSTWVNLGGPITLPAGTSTYRFAGYKGGFLNVTSVLSGATDVVIGDQFVPATNGVDNAVQRDRSGVSLDAVNTYSGGTRLEAGELIVTNASSLGTGALTVNGDAYAHYFDDDQMPVLMPNSSNLVLGNPVTLNSWLNTRVTYDSGDRNFELSGVIDGYNGILKSGQGTLTLSGHNTFEGGVYVRSGVVKFQTDDAAGTGPLGFGSSASQQVFFNSSNPTVSGIYTADYDDDYATSTIFLASGSTLTIAPENYFHYNYAGSIVGEGGIAISGAGTQELTGFNSFTGGTTVTGGATLRTNHSHALGSAGHFDIVAPGSVSGYTASNNPSVTLNNGNLFVADSSDLYANVSFGTGGGILGGNGTLHFDHTLTVGSLATLSPGESIGRLGLDGSVDFAPGGTLVVELGSGSTGNIITDTLIAANLNISANAVSPFTVMLRDENGLISSTFDIYESGTWLIAGSLGGITNFDLTAFSLQMDSSITALTAGGGSFSLQRASGTIEGHSGTDNILMLNFSPVPEPSTVLLLGLGLTLLGFRRPRRA